MPFLNLRQYDVVLTTAFEFNYGICGHLFEMVDYYWAIKNYTNKSVCILLADGTTAEQLRETIKQKYDGLEIEHIVYRPQPKVIIANTLVVVDGSYRFKHAEIFAKRIILFRCRENNFTYFTNTGAEVHLLQDNRVYDIPANPRLKVQHYTKKILFSKYKQYPKMGEGAMFYIPTICRRVEEEALIAIQQKHNLTNSVVITDDVTLYPTQRALQAPVADIWTLFDTYVYTPVPLKFDCSSRFIAECAFYGKRVIYELDYEDVALNARRQDCEDIDCITLKQDDMFLSLINE